MINQVSPRNVVISDYKTLELFRITDQGLAEALGVPLPDPNRLTLILYGPRGGQVGYVTVQIEELLEALRLLGVLEDK